VNIPLVADSDDLSVRQLVALLKRRRLSGGLEFLLKVQSDIAELLLDVSDDFTLSGGGEGIPTLRQILDQVFGQITTSKIKTKDGVGKGETFVDGDGVGDTISGIQNYTCCSTWGIQREDGLDGNVEGGGIKSLKHDLSHLFTIGLGIQWGLCQKDGMLLWRNTELIVESVMPNLLHVIPVSNHTVFDRVLQGQDTTLWLGFITIIMIEVVDC